LMDQRTMQCSRAAFENIRSPYQATLKWKSEAGRRVEAQGYRPVNNIGMYLRCREVRVVYSCRLAGAGIVVRKLG
jgi:hypothetical protein